MAHFYKTSFFCLIILCLANIGHNTTVRGKITSVNVTDKSKDKSTTEEKENYCEDGNCSSTQTPEIKTVSADEAGKSTPGKTGDKSKADKNKQGEDSKSIVSSGSKKSSARPRAGSCEDEHCSQLPSVAVDIPDKAKVPRSNSSGRNSVVYACLLPCIWIVHLLV